MSDHLDAIALALVSARNQGRFLSDYPGTMPRSLTESYQIQDKAISFKAEPVSGWKIGRLSPEKASEHGTERLTGPIFASKVIKVEGHVNVGVLKGGFAAVEAEYVFLVAKDADPAKTDYSESEAFGLIQGVYAGVEMAGSPLKAINQLGPTVVASDFGNNNGLLIGPSLWSCHEDENRTGFDPGFCAAFKAETLIEGQSVGKGGLYVMPGGPMAAIAWLAGHLAKRAMPLRKGQWISSGASTGIHDIEPDQASEVIFSGPEAGSVSLYLTTYATKALMSTSTQGVNP